MPKDSAELINARREEIIAVCLKLYKTMSFKEITLKEIGKETSFTRTSIYNYFHTKEEIFLAILQKEYELWNAELESKLLTGKAIGRSDFAEILARSLEKRELLLKLLAMNLYDIEENSSIEKLIEFKKEYGHCLEVFKKALKYAVPEISDEGIQKFMYSFFPFVYGIYPYAKVTEKQKEAMQYVGIHYQAYTIYDIALMGVRKLLDVE